MRVVQGDLLEVHLAACTFIHRLGPVFLEHPENMHNGLCSPLLKVVGDGLMGLVVLVLVIVVLLQVLQLGHGLGQHIRVNDFDHY